MREVESLGWRSAPAIGDISGVARIQLSGILRFLDPPGSRRLLELTRNLPNDRTYTLAPRDFQWWSVFSYDASGYVRDDERLDPDELLRSLQRNNEAAAAERRRLGLPNIRLTGWAVPPHYDAQTRRLEWGTRLVSDNGEVSVNYTIRLLGRGGVVAATLVTSPEDLNQDVMSFKAALRGFEYAQGQRYSEFRSGDRSSMAQRRARLPAMSTFWR